MYFENLNYLAIIVVTILNVLLGALWYSPSVLGTTWAEALHLNAGKMKKPTVWQYAGAVLVSLITMWVLAIFVNLLHLSTAGEAVVIAFFIWLGFIATSHFSGVIWVRKPMVAYIIDVGFYLVSLVVSTIILTMWR